MISGIILDGCSWMAASPLGPPLYTAALAMVVICCVPTTMFEILPGFMFGARLGFVVSAVGKASGNFVAIALSKSLLRPRVAGLVNEYEVLRVFQQLFQAHGFLAVFIFRGFVYAPMAIKNYGLGSLEVDAWMLNVAGVLTGAPTALWWAYVGSKAKGLVQIMNGDATESMFAFALPDNPAAVAAAVACGAALLYCVVQRFRLLWANAKRQLQVLDEAKSK